MPLIRSPYPIRRRTITPEQEMEGHLQAIRGLVPQLQEILNQHKERIENLDKAISYTESLKPEKGEPGKDGESPSAQEIVRLLKPHLPKGEPGRDAPALDEKKIIKEILKKIPIPQDGKDAIIDHDAIVEKILGKIIKEKKLSTKHLSDFNEGLEQTIAPIRHLATGFRGGGDTVAAGANVSISQSGGVKTISVTSGLTKLTATETPNGVLTAFTFSAATAKPSFVISDNVWLQATSKAGTVNWTWNSVSKVATLTVPPVDDILAIV